MQSVETSSPFDKKNLQSTVEQELQALNWVEEISADIRVRVSDMIDRFLRDCELNKLKDNGSDLEALLDRACLAVAKTVYHQKPLKQSALEKIGIAKPQQEGLPETLYPAIYIQLLEQSGIPVLAVLREAFNDLVTQKQKIGQRLFLDKTSESLAETNISPTLKDRIGESLKSFLTKPTGRKRLGELLYANDLEMLEKWYTAFPVKTRSERVADEAVDLPTPQAVAEAFFEEKFKYFTGNPVSTPGIVTAFKNSVLSLIGTSQARFLTVETKGGSFLIKLGGTHNVDRKRLDQFKETVETNWKKKFPFGDDLVINMDTNNNGGNEGAFIDI